VSALAEIAALEALLHRELPPVRLEGPRPSSLVAAETTWADAVWREASQLGPAALPPHAIATAATVAQRPVFICGVHRSGTTLVRDLLDDHPALAVLPSEGSFFTNFSAQLQGLEPDAIREHLGPIWLRRIANPINQPPYWLLGRSTETGSPYVQFGRVLAALWPEVKAALPGGAVSWPTPSVALAFTYVLGRGAFNPRLTHWVEKTPTNELHLDKLGAEFRAPRAVHVIRHPFSVVASRKLLEQRATGAFTSLWRVLDDLKRSYAIARARREAGSSRYLVLRYEDITLDPDATADRLAGFLGIERVAGLCCPTVAGEPSRSNTSFMPASARGQVAAAQDRSAATLTDDERDTVNAIVSADAAALGYALPTMPSWRASLIRMKSAIRI